MIFVTDQCRKLEPEPRYVAVMFPDYVWEYLEKVSEETGTPVNTIVSRIVSAYVREEKKNCG